MNKVRKDFPILARKINKKPLVYLDNAATSQKPKQVIDAVSNFYKFKNANVHRGIHTLTSQATEEYENVRQKVANFVGVKDSSEIIFAKNTDEAINLVVYTWGRENIKFGDEIVLTIVEHHANFVCWQQLAKKTGAKLKIIPIDKNGEVDLGAFKKSLSKKTKLVTFFHVSNVLGTINPVETSVKIIRKYNPKIRILIDGAQAVPHIPVDISKIGCDFYAFSAHKMLGPSGIGILWAKKELLEEMSPFIFGGDMIKQVNKENSQWNDLPWKFEAGTPNIEGVIGFGAALDYLNKLGMANIRKHEVDLVTYALKKMSKLEGIKILGPLDPTKRCAVIAFLLSNIPPHDIASILDTEGIEIRSGYNCAEPLMAFMGIGPVARVSFYIYNTKEEVDKFIEGLLKVKKIFNS